MSDQYPHKCPLCQCPAYLGLNTVACTNVWCKHYEAPKFEYPNTGPAYSVTIDESLQQALIKAALKVYTFKAPSGISAWLPAYDDDCDDDDCDASD